MMSESIGRGVRGCLAALAVVMLAGIVFVAGYVSGSTLATAPPEEQSYLFEDEPVRPSPTPDAGDVSPEQPALKSTPAPTPYRTASFEIFWEVWDLIERDFYGDLPSEEERVYGAIRGALQELDDDYTSFIEPDVAEINRGDMSGSFEGIGAHVRMNDANQLEIVLPMEGQPAEAAGIKAGDIVLAVDGESIEGLGIYEAISLIRGPKDTLVVLTIRRQGEPDTFDVEIVRARVPLPTIESKMLEGNIGYVRLYEFNGQATDRLQAALEELLDRRPAGLILDLRNNPGGYLNQAVSVADEFLPAGVVLVERHSDETEKVFESTNKGLADEIPLVVLINEGSASASEIVAGAIQDRDRAVLVGEASFGKGSVQQAHQLSDGSELRITVARWYTPNDQVIHGQGLEPDILIPLTEEDRENDRDPQLERALEYLVTGQ